MNGNKSTDRSSFLIGSIYQLPVAFCHFEDRSPFLNQIDPPHLKFENFSKSGSTDRSPVLGKIDPPSLTRVILKVKRPDFSFSLTSKNRFPLNSPHSLNSLSVSHQTLVIPLLKTPKIPSLITQEPTLGLQTLVFSHLVSVSFCFDFLN